MRCVLFIFSIVALAVSVGVPAEASYHFSNYKGRPPIHVYGGASKTPSGVTPDQIKNIYHLPLIGGSGTIVIVGAYDDPTIESDLATFSIQF
ncbi:MAG: hypothetical protein KGI70_00485, partial [Patescibacteria group bacterium]|nr:hypothetical protein [Patescibacteria group bacterium]